MNINSLSFLCPVDIHPLERLAKLAQEDPFYQSQNTIAKNLTLFFQGVQILEFDIKTRKSTKNYESYKKIYPEFSCAEGSDWQCHTMAPYFSSKEEDTDCYFGFLRQRIMNSWGYKGGEYVILHSFALQHGRVLDPKTDMMHALHKALYGKKSQMFFKNFFYYFGVKMPACFVEDIISPKQKGIIHENLYGFMLKNILPCTERTLEFVNIVKNNGANWRKENFSPGASTIY